MRVKQSISFQEIQTPAGLEGANGREGRGVQSRSPTVRAVSGSSDPGREGLVSMVQRASEQQEGKYGDVP